MVLDGHWLDGQIEGGKVEGLSSASRGELRAREALAGKGKKRG